MFDNDKSCGEKWEQRRETGLGRPYSRQGKGKPDWEVTFKKEPKEGSEPWRHPEAKETVEGARLACPSWSRPVRLAPRDGGGKQEDIRAGPASAAACGTHQLPVHCLSHLLTPHSLTCFIPEPRTSESRGHRVRNDHGILETEESGLVISQNLCSRV